MKKQILTLLAFAWTLVGCQKEKIQLEPIRQYSGYIKDSISDENKKNWFLKDIQKDSLPGISLNMAKKMVSNQKGKAIVIAVIDTKINTDHNNISGYIWKNSNEIEGNKVDDDHNGYVDDIMGWNFIGNSDGDDLLYSNYEYTRIIKKHDSIFNNQNEGNESVNDSFAFAEYKRAKLYYDKENQEVEANSIQYNFIYSNYKSGQKIIQDIIGDKKITLAIIDSLVKEQPNLADKVMLVRNSIEFDIKEEDMIDQLDFLQKSKKFYLNLSYDERRILGDNPEDINNTNYGNSLVNTNTDSLYHGTLTAGVIARSLEAIGIDYPDSQIKIMPISISSFGDENDKDLALAIKYAVDNGAKVINISSGKYFSMHRSWVMDAIKYAEEKNVLIINSAGNDNKNLDTGDFFHFPYDENYNQEISNFIKVGASGYEKGSFRYTNSNYGKNVVDIFAPGSDIYTTSTRNKEGFEYVSGTSFAAPLVSLTAGLLYSYHPNLKVSEIKNIILDSGVAYNIPIEIQVNDKSENVQFSELSKSGKVVNAYNALLMAEELSKK